MPKPDVSDQRIPQILNAAAEVCSEVGIDKASMIQIAKRAGISKAAIYHYFRSKEDMIEGLVRMLFDVDIQGVKTLSQSNLSAGNCLREYANSLAILLEQQRMIFPVFAEIRVVALRNQKINEILSGYYKRYIELFTDIIGRGIESGEFPTMANPEDAALSLASLIEGAILISQTLNKPINKIMNNSVSAFVDALED